MKSKPKSSRHFKYVMGLLVVIAFFAAACTRSYYVQIPIPPIPPDTSLAVMNTEGLSKSNIDIPIPPIPPDTTRYVVLKSINPSNANYIQLSRKIPIPPIPPDTSYLNLIKSGNKNKIDIYYLTNKDLKNSKDVEGKIINSENKTIAISNMTNKGFSFFEVDSLVFAKVSFSFTTSKQYKSYYNILVPNYFKNKQYIISIKSIPEKEK